MGTILYHVNKQQNYFNVYFNLDINIDKIEFSLSDFGVLLEVGMKMQKESGQGSACDILLASDNKQYAYIKDLSGEYPLIPLGKYRCSISFEGGYTIVTVLDINGFTFSFQVGDDKKYSSYGVLKKQLGQTKKEIRTFPLESIPEILKKIENGSTDL